MGDPYIRGDEDYYESSGSMEPVVDDETTILFRGLEHELQIMIQRYHVPPEDLEQLFQVVQNMFELMDSSREGYNRLEVEKNELEDLWKQEKDKLRSTQRRKLELECRLEEERMKIESEKTILVKEKVVLQTKLKQAGEHKESVEQELQRVKERTNKEDIIRKDLLEQYKKQADIMKTHSLRRRGSNKSPSKRHLHFAPERKTVGLITSLRVPPTTNTLERSEEFLEESGEIPQTPFPSEESPVANRHTYNRVVSTKTPRISLEEEFIQQQENTNSVPPDQNGDSLEQSIEYEDSEGIWFGRDDLEGTSLLDEMMDPFLTAPMRAEVEMLQKEKEMWQEDREKLKQVVNEVKTEKENIESNNAQVLVEVRQLKETCENLQRELTEVKNERDEILGHYLEQPFDEYCITRKELNELLKKHQKTAIELAEEKEEKERLEKLLASKRSFLERFKERMRKVFTKPNSPDVFVAYKATTGETSLALPPSPTPLVQSLAPILTEQNVIVEKCWLTPYDSHMPPDKLPQWVGQAILQGMDIEKIESVVIGRVFHAPFGTFPDHMTPRFRVGGRRNPHPAAKLLAGLQQLHAEVWISTTEGSLSYIDIVNVISKPPKVRQRFVVHPKTKHIICMKSIPGVVDHAKDFVDSISQRNETSWMEASFLQPHPQAGCFSQSMTLDTHGHKRPNSAPQRRKTYCTDTMASTPDLSVYSEPGPLEYFSSNRFNTRAGADLHNELVSSDITNSLTTIDEIEQTTSSQVTSTPKRSTPSETLTELKPKYLSQTERNDENGSHHLNETGPNATTENHTVVSSDNCNTQSLLGEMEDGYSHEITSSPVLGYLNRKPLCVSPLHNSNSMCDSSLIKSDSSFGKVSIVKSGSALVPDILVDSPDGRPLTHQQKRGARIGQNGNSPVMWIVTASNMLYFYPTTHPSHKPFNSIKLLSRATCIEYIKGKVFVGHVDSSLSVYYMDEFSHTWDISNPERVLLPSPNPNEVHNVQCIAGAGGRIWVGTGPSIFFLDAELPSSREGSIFLDSWRRKPKQILPLGDIVVVTSSISCLYVFDAQSTHLIQKLNINPIATLLDHTNVSEPKDTMSPPPSHPPPTTQPSIKSVVADGHTLYVGTSTGKIISVPISSLSKVCVTSPLSNEGIDSPVSFSVPNSPSHSAPPTEEVDGLFKKKKRNWKRKDNKKEDSKKEEVIEAKDDEWEELHFDEDGQCLEENAISLHTHNGNQVQSLIHLQLPDNQISKLKGPTDTVPYHSMPNLSSPLSDRSPISPPLVSYRSLILSAGKGHMEYVTETNNEVIDESESGALRERNEAFQLLVWGHRNIL